MKTKHTPTPWTYQDPDSIDGGWIMTDARAWGRQVTGMFYGEKSERVANGHFITLACNHHEELVEALEFLAPRIGSMLGRLRYSNAQDAEMLPKIQSLLTKLKS